MGTAAAIIIRREREAVDAARAAGAVTAARALSLADLGLHDGRTAHRLMRHAVLREAAPGFYYVDEPSWNALRSMRRRMVAVLLLVIVVLGLAGVFASRTPRPEPPAAAVPVAR